MLQDAAKADSRATRLKQRLDEMAKKEQQDLHWLKTVDRLLATLPDTKEFAIDRKWLEVQQAVVFVRLRKNDRLARVKLQVQLQKETDKARAYRNLQQQLLKN